MNVNMNMFGTVKYHRNTCFELSTILSKIEPQNPRNGQPNERKKLYQMKKLQKPQQQQQNEKSSTLCIVPHKCKSSFSGYVMMAWLPPKI